MFDKLREECGVFGVFGITDAATLGYYGLHALQHGARKVPAYARLIPLTNRLTITAAWALSKKYLTRKH